MEIKVLSNFRACWIVAAGEERAGAAAFHARCSTLCYFACVPGFTAHSQWEESSLQRV